MKVCVYAICKNEEKFIKRWYSSCKEADYIYVLDTGSTDNSVNILKSLGINYDVKEFNPWRFDIARNYSLERIPKDIDVCICLDIDEVLLPNWYQELSIVWNNSLSRVRYTYNWSLDKNDNPIVSFYGDKIHNRHNFKWVNPVHEVLKYNGVEKQVINDKIIINHYPDATKSRSSYLPLLELSIKEDPNNDRNMHYLGREYMYYGMYDKAIDTLEKHLKLESATWKDERCASLRFISRCYYYLNRIDEAIFFSNLAIKEAPYLRDSYMEKALITYSIKDYKETEKLCRKALKIKKNPKTYINEAFTKDSVIYDILSIALFNNGKYYASLKYCKMALSIDKDNDRIKKNIKIIKEFIKNKQNVI